MGSRVVHPDATSHFPAGAQTWAKHMMQRLREARDEGLWRLERLNKACNTTDESLMRDYERFQHGAFNLMLAAMSTSDIRYATIGHNSLSASKGRAFCQRLYDFHQEQKQSLKAMSQEFYADKPIGRSTCILCFARTPSEIPDWFRTQLVDIRASNIVMYLVVLLLVPALPCSWKQMRVLSGSAFENKSFDTFKLQKHSSLPMH